MNLLMLSIGFGLVTSGIIALSATAFSLQYSVTSIPNFMHGEFLTAAAFGMLVAERFTNNLLIAAAAGLATAALIAWATDVVVLEPFLRRGAPTLRLVVVTATIGISLQAITAMIFTADPQTLALPTEWYRGNQFGPFVFTGVDIGIMIAAVVAMFGLFLLLQYTKFGKAQRAVADSRELAAASGISTRLVIQVTWLLTGVIAGAAGIAVAATQQSFDPFFGFNFLLVTLSAAVVGGIGRPYGAMMGALVIGLATDISGVYINGAYSQVAALVLLMLTLVFRPSGLLTAMREQE
jgi:branched-chain amino acid transport system permease protein/neutral amino acid transport system permease protein